jgi:aryl-alcohol dehydrogenase-like predicted oxidoreductase
MSTREINRREFITKCSIKLSGASLFLSQYGTKPTFGKEKKPQAEKKKEPAMEYRTLGRTGLKVSVVSHGLAQLKEPAVIFKALDLGINFFDTAHVYQNGNSEILLGKVLKEYGRKKVFIASKIPPLFQLQENPMEKGPLLEKKVMEEMMEKSLKRLQTDYVDVLFVHDVLDKKWLTNETILSFLETLKKEGKARFVGVSLHNRRIFIDVADQLAKLAFYDVLLAWLNFLSSPEEVGALRKVRKKNIGVVAMKTQAGGYDDESTASLSPYQATLAWALNQDFVDCAVPGMKNMEELIENVGAVGKKMRWSDRKILHTYYTFIKHKYCTMCAKCLPGCGNATDILNINRALMYYEGYRDLEQARQTYRQLTNRENAYSCINCSSPTCRCVNGIKIAKRMKYAHSLFTCSLY